MWQKIREIAVPGNSCEYIIWNSKEILIDGKSVFYKNYFVKEVTYYLTFIILSSSIL